MPDKAIDLMDEAASKVRIKNLTTPPDLKEQEERIKRIGAEKDAAVKSQDFEKAAQLRDEEKDAQAKLDEMKKKWSSDVSDTDPVSYTHLDVYKRQLVHWKKWDECLK